MAERFDLVVVGSGAGGGLIAGELADAGVSVLLLEAGPHRTAADFTRWEAHANHDIWFPPALAMAAGADGPPIVVLRGRNVGGTTTVNTKVALRASDEDLAKWHRAAGLLGDGGEPFSIADMRAHYERVEQRLGVRRRTDWQRCITTVAPGFAALGADLEPVDAYTDANCMRCGSCLQGCPTNAGKNTGNVYIHPPWVDGRLTLRARCSATRVTIGDRGYGPAATGVEYLDAAGERHAVGAGAVVVAAGAMATSQLLIRSGVGEAAGGSASSRLIGHNVGWHPARLVAGLFDEIQDAHMVYPISAHCMTHQRDGDGGFLTEASTIQDPIGFATGLLEEDGRPMWGRRLNAAVRDYRRYSSLLSMVTDLNHGRAWVDEEGSDRYSYAWDAEEAKRLEAALGFARDVLRAAGASRVYHSGLVSTHVQGGCRMGSDPARSVVDAHGESHDVRRLFVGDGSVLPCTLSVNPSLTIMALASRLAAYLAGGEHGYFEPARLHAAV
jgi:choline dehydrogenase-like flavoprotein